MIKKRIPKRKGTYQENQKRNRVAKKRKINIRTRKRNGG